MGFKLRRLFESESGKIIVSIILGLGLATLFRKVCDETNCIIYRGTNSNEVVDKTFRYDNKCYKYKLEPTKCSNNNVIFF
jgi:hypothetical protein